MHDKNEATADCFDVLRQPNTCGYLIRQQYLATMGQPGWVCLCAVNPPPPIVLATPTGCLPPSISQWHTNIVLDISFAQ